MFYNKRLDKEVLYDNFFFVKVTYLGIEREIGLHLFLN
jgi:hypothetical protein